MRDAGHRQKIRDCPGHFGTVGTYAVMLTFSLFFQGSKEITIPTLTTWKPVHDDDDDKKEEVVEEDRTE